jgi:hypothetical protein
MSNFWKTLFGSTDGANSAKTRKESLNIVGEFYYKKNFAKIKKEYFAKSGDIINVKLLIKNESDNPKGVRGKAIGVWLEGLKLGHVANSQVPKVYAYLEASGGETMITGTVYFANNRDEDDEGNSIDAYLSVEI